MSLGLASKFNILERSPFDAAPAPGPSPEADSSITRWVPSRYTVRAATTQGSLVLWNTYTNRISVFNPELAPRVLATLDRKGVAASKQGLIRFLVERGFLVSAGTDEYRRFRYAASKQQHADHQLHLFLLASEDCNFRCTYCYEDFARGTMTPSVRAGVKRYLEQQVPGLKQLKLEWFGGEPLYGFEAIADVAPFARQLAEEHGISYLSKITTNAYLLTPDIFDQLLSWRVTSYQITLDGPAEHHDRTRPGRDGSPTFARIFDNLKAMQRREESFGVMLRVNYDRANSDGLEPLLDKVQEELHADRRFRLTFRPIGRLGGPSDRDLDVCNADESMELDLRLREEARKRGLVLSDSIFHAGGVGAQVCYAARPYSFIIGATGKVMKCTVDLDRKDRNVVGSLGEDGSLALDEDKMAMWTEPAYESDVKCRKCVILPACQGMSCPILRWDTGQSPCTTTRTTYKQELREAAGSHR